ncbi:PDDEXK family nuclease [Candidatus Venteria ishoeyi]|nr:hypothetical protein [Candidatus Venteria ishoeyi]
MMAEAALKQEGLTPEDYLKGEQYSQERHEYIDGEVYAMAGESKAYNTITLRSENFITSATWLVFFSIFCVPKTVT